MKTRKYSRKRQAIKEKLMSTKSHPTAQWLHNELKNEHPDIGIATVYRNLNEFCESGEIISLGTINGKERFDAATERHDHFICQACGAIVDVAHGCADEEVYAKVLPGTGAVVTAHHVSYYGKCGKCTEI